MNLSDRHVNRYEVTVERDYAPAHNVLGTRYEGPLTARVVIHADFDDDESALAFERAVREFLEQA